MKKVLKPILEGLAVGCVFISIALLFELSLYVSLGIGALGALGGYHNAKKMDKAKAEKAAAAEKKDD